MPTEFEILTAGANPANWQEMGVAMGALMVLWKGLDIGAKLFHDDRKKKNGSGEFMLPDGFKLAQTIKDNHLTMSLMVEKQDTMISGQQDMAKAFREMGSQIVNAVADHNDTTLELARDIKKTVRAEAD